MTDWSYQNGNLLMMIRDTGSNVEFWIEPDQYTWNNDQPYSYVINGASHSGQVAMSASTWVRIGYANVTSDQTVSMTVTDTGLGFPTHTFSHAIDRASAPSPPAKPILTVRSNTVIELDLGADGANNGAGIDSRQYAGNSTNSTTGATIVNAVNNYQWTGLAPRTTYYFWERTHNAKGYSGWSPVASAKTWGVPDAPAAPKLSNIQNRSIDVTFTDAANNGSGIDDREILYNTTFKTFGGTTVKSDGSTTVLNLLPQQDYYFWVRTHNAYGWSDYSPYTLGTTLDTPAAPTTPVLSEVTVNSLRAVFAANSDGGSAITGYRFGYGTDPSVPQAYTPGIAGSAGLDQILTNLVPGTTYYVWGQAQNTFGWGDLSATPASVRTIAGAWLNVNGVWKQAVPYVKVNGVWKPTIAWAKIAGVWKETR